MILFYFLWIGIGFCLSYYSTMICKIVLYSAIVYSGLYVHYIGKWWIVYVLTYIVAIVCFVVPSNITYLSNTFLGYKCFISLMIISVGGVSEYFIACKLFNRIIDSKVICFLGRNSIYYYIISGYIMMFFVNDTLALVETVFVIFVSFFIPTIFVLFIKGRNVDNLLFKPTLLFNIK